MMSWSLKARILPAESATLYTFWQFLQRHSAKIYNEQVMMKDYLVKESYNEGSSNGGSFVRVASRITCIE